MRYGIGLLMSFIVSFCFAQSADQAKIFINKSHVAIFKVQKEILSHNTTGLDVSLKKAIRFQAIAVQLYKSNNFKEAAEYSYRSRIQSLELLESLNKPATDYFQLNDEEKSFIPADASKLSSSIQPLKDAEEYKIDQLDISNTQKLREIELNLN